MLALDNLQMQTLSVSMDSERIVTIRFDTPGKSVNSLTMAVFDDLSKLLDELEQQKPAGVIFASAKPRSFIAGADLFEIRQMDRTQLDNFLSTGQQVFNRIAALPMPTVAAISGDCLGGGLELALACQRRVAVAEGSVSIGLPEVKLGIVPGWGGTVRLPRLIGLPAALPLLLAGKTLPAKKAARAGIVDEVVRPEVLLHAAKRLLRISLSRKLPLVSRLSSSVSMVRNRIFAAARDKTRETTRGHYPAAERLIDVIRAGVEGGTAAGLEAERKALIELTETDTCRNLLRLFFLRQAAKRAVFDQLHEKPADVQDAAVIGGGTMGAGIAHGLIRAGISVRLIEVDPKAVSGALGRVRKMLDEDVGSGRMSALEARHAFNRLAPTCEWTGLHLADIVIEAVAEHMNVKRQVFAKLDQLTRPDAVLATNTSSLRVSEMAHATKHPGRVVGLHFFNPVPKMPLAEIVRAADSDDRTLATATAVAIKMGKTPVLVKDAPGFLVNRVLIPYLAEALRAASEGWSITDIDRAMKDWGMPMGPFELVDEIGLDISLHVLKSLSESNTSPAGLEQAISRGFLGKKSGKGFYVHGARKSSSDLQPNSLMHPLITSQSAPGVFNAEEVQWRLVLPMINEAARLLQERVTDSTDAIDLATVLGTGLAPFRGGLAHFADTVGTSEIVSRMEAMAIKHGPRFAPASLLLRLSAAGRPLSAFDPLVQSETSPASSAMKPAHA